MFDFTPIDKAMKNEESEFCFFEPFVNLDLAEQLAWRKGDHIHNDPALEAQFYMDFAKMIMANVAVCNIDDAKIEDGELKTNQDILPYLESKRFQNMTFAYLNPNLTLTADSKINQTIADNYSNIAKSKNLKMICLCDNLKTAPLDDVKKAIKQIHEQGRYAVATYANAEEDLDLVCDCGFDGVYIDYNYKQNIYDIYDKYNDKICIIAGAKKEELSSFSPKDVIDFYRKLHTYTKGRHFIATYGNINMEETDYLKYISMLSV